MITPTRTDDAIDLYALSKSFRAPYIPKYATLKDAIVSGRLFGWGAQTRCIQALQNVSLRVRRGTTLGLIGRNGSGKSTLLKLIAGVLSPDAGTIHVNGRIAPLLSLGTGFHPDLTGRENAKIGGLILGLHPRDVDARMGAIASFAELEDFMDMPLRTYSSGMYMRLAFSVAISVDPDVLLLDEVFAVGDAAFNQKCIARMNAFRTAQKTIVFVSHDLESIRSFCDTAAWIEAGTVVAVGDPSDVIGAYGKCAAERSSLGRPAGATALP